MRAGNRRDKSGFTLIELLVTIAVLVIAITIAIPNFQNMTVRSRLSADFNEILTGLHYARSEAAKARADITVEITDSWNMVIKNSENETLRVLKSKDTSVSISPIPFSVTFNPLGRRKNCSDSCSLSIIYQDTKQVNINLSGNIIRP